MKWVSYAKHWWRMHSIQGAAVIIATCVIKTASLAVLFPFLPWSWVAVLIVVFAILLSIGALRDQQLDKPKPRKTNAGMTTQ